MHWARGWWIYSGEQMSNSTLIASRLLKNNSLLPCDSPGATCGRYFPREIPRLFFVQGVGRPPVTPTQGVFQHPASALVSGICLLGNPSKGPPHPSGCERR